jgi:uncharacterized protein YfaS (alpha-2-macroglobulin family)
MPETPSGHKKSTLFTILWIIGLALIVAVVLFMMNSKKPGIFAGAFQKAPSVPSIATLTPSGEIIVNTNLTFDFPKDIIDEAEVGNDVEKPLVVFTPEVSGRFRWISPAKLRFFPLDGFKPATQYKARVSDDVVALDGQPLSGNRTFEFHTTPLRIDNVWSNFIFEQNGSITTKVEWHIVFNQKVNPSDLSRFIEMRLIKGKQSEKLSYGDLSDVPSESISVISDPVTLAKKEKAVIELTIKAGLAGVEGPLGLENDFVRQMPIEPDLKVYSVTADPTSTGGFVTIRFSSDIDPEVAKEYISLEPKIDYRLESEYSTVKLFGKFHPNDWYTVKINKGLIGRGGKTLRTNFTQRVKFGDLPMRLAFQSKGIYLPRTGSKQIAFECVNVDTVRLEVDKIYANNIVPLLQNSGYYGYWYSIGNVGRNIYTEKITPAARKNETAIIPIDIGKYEEEGHKGVFRVTVRDDDEYWTEDQTIVLITDIGIVSSLAENDLFVWVNSLHTMKALSGVEIKLFSRNNQVIASGVTDVNGMLVVRDLKSKTDPEQYVPFVITAKKGEDASFLQFEQCRMPLASFDIAGRPLIESGYEAFVYSERDVYRPNDKAHFAALVRGPNVVEPESFPVKLKILDPQGNTFDVVLKSLKNKGLTDFELDIPSYAKTGLYSAKLLVADDEIGRMDFHVEDFIPDQTEVDVKTDKTVYRSGDPVQFDVTGKYMFGPPAKDREVSAKMLIKASPFEITRWAEYTFGDEDRKFDETEIDMGSAKLDENGEHTFQTTIPQGIRPPQALKGVLSATVKEQGGRAVSAHAQIDIHPYPFYIGLRPKVQEYAEIGKQYDLEFICVTPDGKEMTAPVLQVEVYKVIWNSLLQYDDNGYYRYVSERNDSLIESSTLAPSDKKLISYTPEDYGSYKVVVTDPSTGSSSSLRFYASGWGYAPWSMENPSRVDIVVEKELYKSGESAKLLIKAPFPGKALLIVQREKVFDFRIFDMKENTATIEVPIKDTYKPNVYATVTVIKSLDDFDGRSPLRAFGIAPIMVDATGFKLGVEINAPDVIRPGKKAEFKLKVTNPGKSTYCTIAAVDEGILQLSDFLTPDPFEFFYGKKRLNAEYFDIFNLVLPELDKFNQQPAGDDFMAGVRQKHLTPVGIKRVVPLSLWSGVIKPDNMGIADVSFDIPEFQGQVRVMALVTDSNRVGSASKKVFIRDEIVLQPTFPMFISSLDEFTIPVTVFNQTGKDGTFDVTLDIEGQVNVLDGFKRKLTLKSDTDSSIAFKAKVGNSIGKAHFKLTATGNGFDSSSSVDVPIRPASPVINKTGSLTITPEKSSKISIPGGFVESTQNAKVIVTSFPQIQFAGSLQYLLSYPHGCAEQTTSKVFPLLYFDQLAKQAEPELFEKNSAWYFVEEGISKLVSMQHSNGSFAYWPNGDYTNTWTSIYVSHFLVEARIAGFEIPKSTYDSMISWLKGYVKTKTADNYDLQRITYACYVLSLAGEPPKSAINYLKESMLNKLPVASQYQLASCFSILGDDATALSLLPDDIQPILVKRETGNNFNSSVRDNAIMLDALVRINPDHPGIAILAEKIGSESEIGRWGTTQDNAFALMALGKALATQKDFKYTGKLMVNGKLEKEFDETGFNIENADLTGKQLEISINGYGKCYMFWQAWGVPMVPSFDEVDKGISVNRTYLDMQGNPLDYNQIKHGDLIVAKITMQALNSNLENVIIDDMLPAGLEIENPRLESRAGIPWITSQAFKPDYMDIRDDRLLIYTMLMKGQERTFYYALRAVTIGNFILPPVSAECMYDPAFTSVQSSGRISIVE